jgi:hypothetical protein
MRRSSASAYSGLAKKEATMNTTDMYSRERSSQAHLDDIRRETHDSRLLREASTADGPEAHAANRRRALVLAGASVAALLAAVLVIYATSGQPIV